MELIFLTKYEIFIKNFDYFYTPDFTKVLRQFNKLYRLNY